MSEILRFDGPQRTAQAPINPCPEGRCEYIQGLFRVAAVTALSQLPIGALYEMIEREGVHLGEDWHGLTVGRVLPISSKPTD